METFYKRVHIRLIELDRKRAWLLDKAGIKASTWASWEKFGRIPPADRALAVADVLGLSLEFLVDGRETPFDFRRENPMMTRITQLLLEMDEKQMTRALAVVESIHRGDSDAIAERMEKLTDLLTTLARHIDESKMTRRDKERSKDLLNRIVLNVYEQRVEVHDEWADLESIE